MKLRSAGHLPSVSIVILNWNGKDDTLACLDSVLATEYSNKCIVVVDNGSTDGSATAIKNHFPSVELLETGKNLGYAGGNNVGIRHALSRGAEFVLLLNNDTIVSADLVHAFVSTASRGSPDDVLGARIFYFDKPDILWFAGARWQSKTQTFVIEGLGLPDASEFPEEREADYITGCALFTSANTFKRVGLLDEKYFLTYEETDWCYRARARGLRCRVIPEAKLWHKVSASFGGETSPLVTYFMTRNRLLWARNHCSSHDLSAIRRQTWQQLRIAVLPLFILPKGTAGIARRVVWGLATWWRKLRGGFASPQNRALLYAIRDYYLGSFGDCAEPVRRLSKRT